MGCCSQEGVRGWCRLSGVAENDCGNVGEIAFIYFWDDCVVFDLVLIVGICLCGWNWLHLGMKDCREHVSLSNTNI